MRPWQAAFAQRIPVGVGAGPADIELVIPDNALAVEVVAGDPPRPVAAATIEAFLPEHGLEAAGRTSLIAPMLVATARTDEAGRAELRGLPDLELAVCACKGGSGATCAGGVRDGRIRLVGLRPGRQRPASRLAGLAALWLAVAVPGAAHAGPAGVSGSEDDGDASSETTAVDAAARTPPAEEPAPAEPPAPPSVGLLDLGRGWLVTARTVGVVPEIGYFDTEVHFPLADWLRVSARLPFRLINHHHVPGEEPHTDPCLGTLSIGVEGVHGGSFPGWRFGWEFRGRLPTVAGCGLFTGDDEAAAVSAIEFAGATGVPGGGIEARAGVGGSWGGGFVQVDAIAGVAMAEYCDSTDDVCSLWTIPRIGIALAGGVRIGAGLAATLEVRGLAWLLFAPVLTAGLRWEGSTIDVGAAAGVVLPDPQPVVEGSLGVRF